MTLSTLRHAFLIMNKKKIKYKTWIYSPSNDWKYQCLQQLLSRWGSYKDENENILWQAHNRSPLPSLANLNSREMLRRRRGKTVVPKYSTISLETYSYRATHTYAHYSTVAFMFSWPTLGERMIVLLLNVLTKCKPMSHPCFYPQTQATWKWLQPFICIWQTRHIMMHWLWTNERHPVFALLACLCHSIFLKLELFIQISQADSLTDKKGEWAFLMRNERLSVMLFLLIRKGMLAEEGISYPSTS